MCTIALPISPPTAGPTGSPALRSPGRLWLVIFAACFVAAVLNVLQTWLQVSIDDNREANWQILLFQGTEWLFLAALTPLTYAMGRRFPLRRPGLARPLAMHIAGAAMLCIGWATAGVLLRRALGNDQSPFWLDLASWTLTSVPWSFFMYFAVLGCVHAFSYYLDMREREAQTAKLTAQLAEARLGALRMQLQPHFLFNSLNAITVLVRDQRIQPATRMLELLSDVLRQVLRSDQPNEVPLEDELQLVQQYLAIEEVRFSDRLRITYTIEDDARSAAVPTLILQPLVENALRHGVAHQADAARIEIGARRIGGELELWVRDDGPGPKPGVAREGVGLENTRLRLTTMYGPAARIVLEHAPGGGALARIRLPYRGMQPEEKR